MSPTHHELAVADTSQLAAARALAMSAAGEVLDASRVDDVALAASELLTNALHHGTGAVRFEVRVDDDVVRLSADSAADGEVVIATATPVEAVRGRGLLIVSTVADAVAVDAVDGHVAVSCEFRRDRAGQ